MAYAILRNTVGSYGLGKATPVQFHSLVGCGIGLSGSIQDRKRWCRRLTLLGRLQARLGVPRLIGFFWPGIFEGALDLIMTFLKNPSNGFDVILRDWIDCPPVGRDGFRNFSERGNWFKFW